MAWGLKTFGSTAWGFGDVSTAVTSTNAIASHAVGNETIVGGTGVTFGVNSVGAFATGFVGEEVVWFEIPTNTSGAASYGIINTSGATGSWQNIIG